MLSFFGHPYIAPAACYEPAPEPSLDALLRLFSGLDNARAPCHPAQRLQARRPQRPQACAPRHMNVRPRPVPTFTPRFDVRETANAYVLHGDLAGLQRDNVRVEFVDPQTLVLRGRVEGVYESQPQQQTEETTVNTAAPGTAPTETPTGTPAPETSTTEPAAVHEQNKPEEEVEVDWEEVESTTSSTHSKYHRPTVEDDADDNDSHSSVSAPKSVTSETAKPETKETAPTPAPETKEVQKAAVPQAPAPAPAKAANERVWLSERSVGEFSRAFTFAERVDQDRVTATLDNGVLSVVVPKAPKHVVRRVLIF